MGYYLGQRGWAAGVSLVGASPSSMKEPDADASWLVAASRSIKDNFGRFTCDQAELNAELSADRLDWAAAISC